MKSENHPHYPEEYKIGEVIFFGKKFTVTPDVLIPRLETEFLVRRARKILLEKNFSYTLDIGSGSGIIGTSVADLCKQIFFIDISKNALQIAEKNFSSHFGEIFIRKNFFENTENSDNKWKKISYFLHQNLLENWNPNTSEKILILANLPYIKNDDWGNMSEDTIFEPKIALFGGEKTGFELYEKLFFQIQDKNISGIAIIEFGFDQRKIAENFFNNNFPHWKVEFFADFAGIERFAEIHF